MQPGYFFAAGSNRIEHGWECIGFPGADQNR
jgi:hypothetical protein